MFDRHWVTDVALAALIVFPAVLPASQGMRAAAVHSAPPAADVSPASIPARPAL